MAIDKKTLRIRSVTAVVFALVMLAGLIINVWSFLLLFLIIHFGCWYEFIRMIKKIWPGRYFPFGLLGLLYITLPVVAIVDLSFQKNVVAVSLSGAHFTHPWVGYYFSTILPIAIILSIWINDTMAYIVGSMIGKTPFSKISPKKPGRVQPVG